MPRPPGARATRRAARSFFGGVTLCRDPGMSVPPGSPAAEQLPSHPGCVLGSPVRAHGVSPSRGEPRWQRKSASVEKSFCICSPLRVTQCIVQDVRRLIITLPANRAGKVAGRCLHKALPAGRIPGGVTRVLLGATPAPMALVPCFCPVLVTLLPRGTLHQGRPAPAATGGLARSEGGLG